jgi:hypothetical protein
MLPNRFRQRLLELGVRPRMIDDLLLNKWGCDPCHRFKTIRGVWWLSASCGKCWPSATLKDAAPFHILRAV